MKLVTAILLIAIALVTLTIVTEWSRAHLPSASVYATAPIRPNVRARAVHGKPAPLPRNKTRYAATNRVTGEPSAHPSRHHSLHLPHWATLVSHSPLRIAVRIRPMRLPRIEVPLRRHADAISRKPDGQAKANAVIPMPTRPQPPVPPSDALKPKATLSMTPSPLRLGIAHTSRGETAFTVDLVHRDVAVNPIGIRVKVGEWGGGVFVAKRLGKGSGFDVGPQLNYQAGRSFVGVGYEIRNRAVVGMVGTKW